MLSVHSHSFKNETPPGFAVLAGLLASQPVQEIEMRAKEISRDGPVRQVAPLPEHHDFVDLTDRVFGRLKVVSHAGKHLTMRKWNCRCECGNWVAVAGANLIKGTTASCGCLHSEVDRELHTSHGDTGTALYNIWIGMKERCENSSGPGYKRYGGRGIVIHPAFSEYEGFKDYVMSELGPRPTDRHSLDRVDNERGYEPGNIRWATSSQQARNRRSGRLVTMQGERMTLAEAAERTGINYMTAWDRLQRGWTDEEALSTPAGQRRPRSRP